MNRRFYILLYMRLYYIYTESEFANLQEHYMPLLEMSAEYYELLD